MSNKMKRHNARQSLHRLLTETQLLWAKMVEHLNSDGLHQIEFQEAEHSVAHAIHKLREARDWLE